MNNNIGIYPAPRNISSKIPMMDKVPFTMSIIKYYRTMKWGLASHPLYLSYCIAFTPSLSHSQGLIRNHVLAVTRIWYFSYFFFL